MNNDRTEKSGEFALDRAILRSHCAGKYHGRGQDAAHECIGAISIMADRVVLSCRSCGVERVACRQQTDCAERRDDALVALTRKAVERD